MPQCPHCQTPYEAGARYCSVCGSFLLHPEEGDTFCPQCSIRVSPRQEFCHECDAPLKVEAAPAKAPAPEPPPATIPPEHPAPGPPSPGMQPWVVGLLAGAGVIIIILLVLLFLRGVPPSPPAPGVAPKAEAPAPAVPAPAPGAPPSAPTAALRDQLLSLLSTLREAHLKKDIDLYMSCYSKSFPGLDEKRKNTLAAWKTYDYSGVAFTLDEIQPVDPDNVNARATWYIDAQNRRTQEMSIDKQVYKIKFTKESGKWLIRSLEEVD